MSDKEMMQLMMLKEIERKVSNRWLSDLSSNLAGNALWDGAVWVVSRLIRKL